LVEIKAVMFARMELALISSTAAIKKELNFRYILKMLRDTLLGSMELNGVRIGNN